MVPGKIKLKGKEHSYVEINGVKIIDGFHIDEFVKRLKSDRFYAKHGGKPLSLFDQKVQ